MENIFSIPRTNRHSNDRRKNKLNIDPVYKKKNLFKIYKMHLYCDLYLF